VIRINRDLHGSATVAGPSVMTDLDLEPKDHCMNSKRGPGAGPIHSSRRAVLLAALIFAAFTGPGAAEEKTETLDRQLLRQAPKVIQFLKERGFNSVGVLKFRVKNGDQPISDHVGPLNLNLAERLEIALILAVDLSNPIGIVHGASAVAATLPGANHLTQPGRQALFQGRYPLAWGNRTVEADAFLTGVVVVSRDLGQMTVGIMAFGKDGEALEKVVEFQATTDSPALVEVGESFLIRGAFDAGRTEVVRDREVVTSAARVKAAQETNPLQDPEAPLELEILYDNQRVPLQLREGKALILEPREGQDVLIVLRKVDKTRDRFGVVLSVNGENTLYRGRLSPLQSWKWIMSPEIMSITIRGYQTGEKTAEAFRVLSSAESRANVMNYGADVGTISMVVFREARGAKKSLALDDEAEDLAALTGGNYPRRPPANLAALRFQLRSGAANASTRGLIAQGKEIGSNIRRIEFQPDPTPVMSATITYYRP
jgi:hypothetical protein